MRAKSNFRAATEVEASKSKKPSSSPDPQLTYFPVEGSEPETMMNEMREAQKKMENMRTKA